MPKVLIVEDDEIIAQGMVRHLAEAGFNPAYVTKGETGLARLRFERPDVCVVDLMLPGMDGWNLIETARREGIGTPIVVVSARGRVLDRDELLQKIWGRRATHRDRTVDVFIRKLREKIDKRASQHTFVQTRYGVGYAFEPKSK